MATWNNLAQNITFHVIAEAVRAGKIDKSVFDWYVERIISDPDRDITDIVAYDNSHRTDRMAVVEREWFS